VDHAPAPKKDLAKAKEGLKPKPQPKKETKPRDPKKGTGNNSARPGRPEREGDRKGRTYPKKSATGYDGKAKRDGKEWGQNKRVEDGVSEAKSKNALSGEAEPRVRRDRNRNRGDREGNRNRGDRERKEEIVELTDAEKAELQAQKELEARQMTLEEYQAKRNGQVADVELKEARKVEDADLKKLTVQKKAEPAAEWGGAQKKTNKKKQGQKKQLLEVGTGKSNKNNNNKREEGGKKKNQNANLNLDDASSFPSLGGK
jgi:hypothetical protein